jgi:hypothetical protein
MLTYLAGGGRVQDVWERHTKDAWRICLRL